MELLITLIGNAAVDPNFRKQFLDDPADVIDKYGFLLTKGDFELLETVFIKATPKERKKLEEAFSVLEELLYKSVTCTHPCRWSIYPPAHCRAARAA